MFLGAFAKLFKAVIGCVISVCFAFRLFVSPSVLLSVCPHGKIQLQLGRFIKFRICIFFENMSRKIKFLYNLTRIMGAVHEDQYTFLIISGSFLLRIKNISKKRYRENQITHFKLNDFFLENRAFCGLWGKMLYNRIGYKWQYGACALYVEYLRLQAHMQIM